MTVNILGPSDQNFGPTKSSDTEKSTQTSKATQTDQTNQTKGTGNNSTITDSDTKKTQMKFNIDPSKVSSLPNLEKIDGGLGAPDGPGGVANPWFTPSFLVAYTILLMDVQKTLLELGYQEGGELAVKSMTTSFEVAMTLSALELSTARAEAWKERLQAFSSFAQAAVALGTFAIKTGVTAYKANDRFAQESKARESNMDTAKIKMTTADTDFKNQDAKFAVGGEFRTGAFANLKEATRTPPTVIDAKDFTSTGLTQRQIDKYNSAVEKRNTLESNKINTEADFKNAETGYETFKANELGHKAQYMREFSEQMGFDVTSRVLENVIQGSFGLGSSVLTEEIGRLKQLMQQNQFFAQSANKMTDKFMDEANKARDGLSKVIDLLMRLQDMLKDTFGFKI